MSRDWRPFEQVIYDENAYLSRGEYIHDGKFTMHLKKEDEGIKLWNDDARKEFPNLSFLLNHFETATYDRIKNEKSGVELNVYKNIEKEIGLLADAIRKQIKNNEKLSLDNIKVSDTTKDWFLGELDECFYYNEENDRLFNEYIENLILDNMKDALSDVINEREGLDDMPRSDNRGDYLDELYIYLSDEIKKRENNLETELGKDEEEIGEER